MVAALINNGNLEKSRGSLAKVITFKEGTSSIHG
jgi:hypothetical protein